MYYQITDEQIDEATKDIGLQSPFARYRIARAVLALAEPAPHGAIDLLSEFSEAMSDSGDWPDTYDERTRLKSLVDRVRFYLKPAEQWATVPKGGEEWSTVPKGYTAPAPHGEPYGWAVTGCHSLYRGEWAESTAQAEAKRCGGTAVAFPLYTAPAPAVPSGWKLVPVEPTQEMLAAVSWPECARTDWEHMLTAAPTPPAQGPDWLHLKRYGYAPGNYMCRCHRCGQVADGLDKRANCCRPCAEDAHAAKPAAQSQPMVDLESWINDVVREVAELPDRDSPEDQPDVMLVRADELRLILRSTPPPKQPAVPEDVVRNAKRYRWLRNHGFKWADVDLGTDSDGENFVGYRIKFHIPDPAHSKYEDDEWTLEELDAAIDAARAAEKGGA